MEIKGTAIRSMLLGLERVSAPRDVERVRDALPAWVRAQIDAGVLASKSYPVGVSAALQEAIRTELGGGACVMNRRIGGEAARIDFGGVYRIFLRVADYERTLRRLDRAWKQYNSRGGVTLAELSRDHAQIAVDDVEGFNEPMWHAIAGRLEGLLVLAGAAKASATIAAWSAHGCTYEVRWVR
jgi:hypothetical protein